jgi:DOPA 4,5-dioxygenase
MQYHAHLYFHPHQLNLVEQVVNEIKQNFNLPVGRIHNQPVGPHPIGSCQIIFRQPDDEQFITWLETHRQDLDVLIHQVTGNDYLDHTQNISWLGQSHELDLSIF